MNYGEWIHEAVFLADGLEVIVDQMNVSPFKPGSIQAVVLYNEKKKLALGVNAAEWTARALGETGGMKAEMKAVAKGKAPAKEKAAKKAEPATKS